MALHWSNRRDEARQRAKEDAHREKAEERQQAEDARAQAEAERKQEAAEEQAGENGTRPGSPEAGGCAQAEEAEPLTENQFDEIQRAIYDLQESHTEGSPEDAAEAGAQAAAHRLKVLLAEAGAKGPEIPGDAEVALEVAEGEA